MKIVKGMQCDKHYGVGFDVGVTTQNAEIVGKPAFIFYLTFRVLNVEPWLELHVNCEED